MRGLRFYQQFFSFLGASGIGALIFFDKRSTPEDQRDERGSFRSGRLAVRFEF